jgi:hypothetical protein
MSQKAIESKTFQWTKHTVEDFTFSYPNTWEINQKKAMGTSFIIFSHLEDKNDSFRDNVNLIVQDISSYNLNLDLYTELSIEQIKNYASA